MDWRTAMTGPSIPPLPWHSLGLMDWREDGTVVVRTYHVTQRVIEAIVTQLGEPNHEVIMTTEQAMQGGLAYGPMVMLDVDDQP